MKQFLLSLLSTLLLLTMTFSFAQATQEKHQDVANTHEEQGKHKQHDEELNRERQNHEGHNEHDEGIALTTDELKQFGASFGSAGPGTIRQQAILPGEIRLNKEAVAHITPPFPAKITRVVAKIGDRVKAGEVLAIAENSDTLSRFQLKSLIDGVVINRHITLGEHLLPSDTAFVIADLSTLWADIALYPQQVAQVKSGQDVVISTAHGPAPTHTQIDYVSPIVDEKTRTGLARVFLDNASGQWKPGMFIEARIRLSQHRFDFVVPRTAVIELNNQNIIFVKEDHRWHAKPVELGLRDEQRVQVKKGLASGDTYVTKGGFILKAQQQKGQFQGGHHH